MGIPSSIMMGDIHLMGILTYVNPYGWRTTVSITFIGKKWKKTHLFIRAYAFVLARPTRWSPTSLPSMGTIVNVIVIVMIMIMKPVLTLTTCNKNIHKQYQQRWHHHIQTAITSTMREFMTHYCRLASGSTVSFFLRSWLLLLELLLDENITHMGLTRVEFWGFSNDSTFSSGTLFELWQSKGPKPLLRTAIIRNCLLQTSALEVGLRSDSWLWTHACWRDTVSIVFFLVMIRHRHDSAFIISVGQRAFMIWKKNTTRVT